MCIDDSMILEVAPYFIQARCVGVYVGVCVCANNRMCLFLTHGSCVASTARRPQDH